ncbi:hypothetical protein [Massilibacteroides sp.]|uniref:hypothetical protein n=1 Tax=Massilibacteroides sp. TaxID=2034766 RepID=UPI0026282772|nr:hypothetical protein [Massilibacteroides sp.]MDD4515656.1 hypothetical protein [Massilibacteroides sp.]
METNEKLIELLDKFACEALNALISKSPFFDSKNEYGKNINQDELTLFKKELCKTAYEYAEYMMIERETAKEWIYTNNMYSNI